MSIVFHDNAPAILADLTRFLMTDASSLPEHTREALVEFANHPSLLERLANTAEALYAAKADLTKSGRDLTAQIAQFLASYGMFGMAERGPRIAAAMQRIGGYAPPEGTSWPSAGEDPAPVERFLEPAPPPEEPPVS